MKNRLSYCWLVDAKIRVSDKGLPVPINMTIIMKDLLNFILKGLKGSILTFVFEKTIIYNVGFIERSNGSPKKLLISKIPHWN